MATEGSVSSSVILLNAESAPWAGPPDQVTPVGGLKSESSIERFHDALRLAQAPTAVGASESAGTANTQPLAGLDAESVLPSGKGLTYGRIDAATGLPDGRVIKRQETDRVAEHSAAPDTQGDAILDGLSYLRGTFDDHINRLKALSSSGTVSTEQLIAIQVELAQFSLLMDVTSKLAGKSAQTFDTLMKGQ